MPKYKITYQNLEGNISIDTFDMTEEQAKNAENNENCYWSDVQGESAARGK